jgi:hypothetical protein
MNALTLSSTLAVAALAVIYPNHRQAAPPAAPAPAHVSFATANASLRSVDNLGWEPAMAAYSADSESYRARASKEIDSYALATRAMGQRCDDSRSYLHTRLQALREHVDYAREELSKLPVSQGETDFVPAQAHFTRTMNGLQEAFTQVLNEVEDGA